MSTAVVETPNNPRSNNSWFVDGLKNLRNKYNARDVVNLGIGLCGGYVVYNLVDNFIQEDDPNSPKNLPSRILSSFTKTFSDPKTNFCSGVTLGGVAVSRWSQLQVIDIPAAIEQIEIERGAQIAELNNLVNLHTLSAGVRASQHEAQIVGLRKEITGKEQQIEALKTANKTLEQSNSQLSDRMTAQEKELAAIKEMILQLGVKIPSATPVVNEDVGIVTEEPLSPVGSPEAKTAEAPLITSAFEVKAGRTEDDLLSSAGTPVVTQSEIDGFTMVGGESVNKS